MASKALVGVAILAAIGLAAVSGSAKAKEPEKPEPKPIEPKPKEPEPIEPAKPAPKPVPTTVIFALQYENKPSKKIMGPMTSEQAKASLNSAKLLGENQAQLEASQGNPGTYKLLEIITYQDTFSKAMKASYVTMAIWTKTGLTASSPESVKEAGGSSMGLIDSTVESLSKK